MIVFILLYYIINLLLAYELQTRKLQVLSASNWLALFSPFNANLLCIFVDADKNILLYIYNSLSESTIYSLAFYAN